MARDVHLTAGERECLIYIDDVDKKIKADVTIRRYMTKFNKAGWVIVEEFKNSDGLPWRVVYEAPENAITIRSLSKIGQRSGNIKKVNNKKTASK